MRTAAFLAVFRRANGSQRLTQQIFQLHGLNKIGVPYHGAILDADVGDGLEVDGYFGYGFDLGELSLSVGYTGYFYTGDFDDTYQEINLGAGFGMLSLDVAIGEYDGDFDEIAPGDQDAYTFVSLTIEHEGFYGTLGSFSQDADGEYLELGYGTTVADIDVGIALILANEDLIGTDDESLVFSLGKSFDLN